jgi:hypothetical protein
MINEKQIQYEPIIMKINVTFSFHCNKFVYIFVDIDIHNFILFNK